MLDAMLKAIVVAAATCAVSSAQAQTPQAEPDVIVIGERLREMAREFVGEIAVAPSGEQQMARWDRRICPLVAGLPERQMRYIADRIAARAHRVGLRTERQGCRANILIFVTPDAQRFARSFADEFPTLVGYYSDPGLTTLGRGPLEEFATSDAPVRWWHVNQTVSGDGQELGTEGAAAPVVQTFQSPSRLRRITHQDFLRVFIIVDARQADGIQMQALSDYLAMVALAQLDPEGETTGISSILNLFSDAEAGAPPPSAMTTWDEAYLDGLYTARRTAPTDVWQRRDIVRRIVDDLSPAGDDGSAR